MSAENDGGSGSSIYCTNCGSSIPADAESCPECGATQTNSIRSEDTSGDEEGFTSWAIGFKPGATGRNILMGLAYFFFSLIGVILLLVAYAQRGGKYKKRAYVIAAVLILLFGVAAATGDAPEENVPSGEEDGTAEPESQGSNDDESSSGADNPDYEVRIRYNGPWSGSIGHCESGSCTQESYQSQNDGSIAYNGDVDSISASIQKEDDSSSTLTVQILEDGEVVAEGQTSAEYGVVSVSESFY